MDVIYGLIDPRTNRVRYVGQSRNIQQRYENHRTTGGSGGRKLRQWIKDLRTCGMAPQLIILEEVTDVRLLDRKERKWINRERQKANRYAKGDSSKMLLNASEKGFKEERVYELLRSIRGNAAAALNAMNYHVDLDEVRASLTEIVDACRRNLPDEEEEE